SSVRLDRPHQRRPGRLEHRHLVAGDGARNFGGEGQVSHTDRYARGEEFMSVVKALWDSWAADAVVDDRASGLYAKPDRIRPANHRGDFYRVAGPLNLPRCPQGRPVLV